MDKSSTSRDLLIDNLTIWGITLVQYISYLTLAELLLDVAYLLYYYKNNQRKFESKRTTMFDRERLTFVFAAIATLYTLNGKLLDEKFILLGIAWIVMRYRDLSKPQTINYGVGMACSFFEGYLAHVIPSDGAQFVGFEENINIYQGRDNVVFPVKKLFIVITKSLHCPPNLKEFNKSDPNAPYLEACKSFEDVVKNVAGVINRKYRNSAYKIHRPGLDPVYLAVECATPLHTLYLVLNNRSIYEEAGSIDAAEVVGDFCTTLEAIVHNSPKCRGKCQLVYYDDLDPNQNLAQILLDTIRDIEPNFETITRR